MARHPNENGCVNCSKAFRKANGSEGRPPCMDAHQYANAHHQTTLMVFETGVIGGGPCAWHAEWQELHPLLQKKNYLLHNPPEYRRGSNAAAGVLTALSISTKGLGSGIGNLPNADSSGYVNKGGQRVYTLKAYAGEVDFVILIARPNDPAWNAFSNQYMHKVTNHGHYDRNVKYLLAIQEAARITPGEFGKFLKELTEGQNLVRSILIFTLFAAGTAIAMSVGGVARALALLLGLGMDAAMFASCANKLVEFGTEIEKADTEEAINKAAHTLNEFCTELAGLLVPQVAGMAVGAAAAMKQRVAKRLEEIFVSSRDRWKQAGNAAEAKATYKVSHPEPRTHRKPVKTQEAPPKVEPNAAEVEAGMWRWHLDGWKRFAKEHRTLAVVRAGNPKSLPHHFDVMVDGKPMLVKWKTAKGGPYDGLVVVPDRKGYGALDDALSFRETVLKLKKAGYKFKPPPKTANGLPEPGALVINENGQALCGDVDAMGVYPLGPSGKFTASSADSFNNNAGLRNHLNEKVYGVNSPTMAQHPGQDFFYAVDPNGKRIMGLQPGANEKFVVFTPDGKHQVVDLTGLEKIYREHNIPWKYDPNIVSDEARRQMQAKRLKELREKHGK